MNATRYDLIVIGGGPAGLAAACSARDNGLRRILVLERDRELGGILNQCIHNGFGLHHFKEELTGPEYARRFIERLSQTDIEVLTDIMALEITPDRVVHAVGKAMGHIAPKAKSIVLATGCRERTRGAIGIPGTRPAGIFTAGTAQRYVNMEGYLVGRRVVILGSGDIGLIMARRMTLEGAKVLACVELMPYAGGLTRNIVQCLNDYQIPLYLSHTITDIQGRKRVERVTVSRVDENKKPVLGTEINFDCDTLLLSVGLIPENELARQAGIMMDGRTGGAIVRENMETSLPGVFACGNAVHVHDLVDFVTAESERAGAAAAAFVLNAQPAAEVGELRLINGDGVGYTVPQIIRPGLLDGDASVFFRVKRGFGQSRVLVTAGGRQIAACRRGHMAPGEMERIVLPQNLLKTLSGEVTISCEDIPA